jgi:TolB-like protein/DNA-binding winged helix-turn-helix (wHTH) protein/Tfp pilus assembly protein PilF
MAAPDLRSGERTADSSTAEMTSGDHLHLFGEFVLDTARGCLLRAGKPVHLRPQAYNALKFLAENRGRLISKNKLVEEVWEGRAVTDDSLVQCLRDVRQALGDDGATIVRNERGRGYIFDPDFDEIKRSGLSSAEQVDVVRITVEEDGDIHAQTPNAHLLPVATVPRKNWKKIGFSIAVVSSLIITMIVGYRFLTRTNASSAAITSIAVLPFRNESGNAATELLADGISESLINKLSQLPQLKVIARNSTFEYKGKDVNVQQIAGALNAQGILVGRVGQRVDDLVVSLELIDARDRTQVWGERYTRKAAEIQGLEEEIARTLSEKLRLRLSGDQEQRLIKHATQNSQAYQFYLNGLFHFRQVGPDDAKRALDYFTQAVALDPDFALAWAGQAQTHLMFAGGSWVDAREANAKAKVAAQRALELDETLADAHAAMALVKQHEWDWAGGEREYLRALELNPSDVFSRFMFSNYLSCMGRHGEALAQIKRAQELDPLQIRLRRQEAWLLHLARRSREALHLMQQLIKLEPPTANTHSRLGFIYTANGMYEEAVAEHRKAMTLFGETTGNQAYLGCALAAAGRTAEARAILDKLKTTKEYVSPEELAGLYAMLGDKEGAFAQLEEAYAAHDLQLQGLKIDPHLDSIRSEPRFQDLVRRVGLPQ